MRLLLFLLLISALMSGHHAQSVAGDLLALHPDLTAGEWLTQHAQDKLELFSATSYSSDPLNIDWCSRAESHFRIGDAELIRQAYFATPPVPDMRLPDDDGPHPELAKQCVLTAIVVKSTPGSRLLEDQLSSIKREMSGHLETGQPFDIKQGAVLSGSMAWTSATEWHLNGSRWIVGMDSNQKLIGLALSQEQDTKESPWLSDFEHQVTIARRFLEETGIPAVEKNEMRTLIDEADKRQATRSPKEAPSPGIWVPFLVRWVRQSKALPAKRRAASLYVADFVLTNVGHFAGNPGPPPAENAIDPEFAKLRTELATVGAHFQYDELGGVFAYTRDWIQEAFRISPDANLASKHSYSCCGVLSTRLVVAQARMTDSAKLSDSHRNICGSTLTGQSARRCCLPLETHIGTSSPSPLGQTATHFTKQKAASLKSRKPIATRSSLTAPLLPRLLEANRRTERSREHGS